MGNEVTVYERVADPARAMMDLGLMIGKSGMFGVTRAEQGVVIAMACFFEKKSPFEVLRTYHFTPTGQLIKKALRQHAEFRALGGKVIWINTGKDGKRAEAKFEFDGQSLTESFTIEEARMQGLVRPNSAWAKTPGNMLRARVLTNALGMLCPEIVAGCGDAPEDAEDISAASSIFAQPVAPAAATASPASAAAPIDVQSSPATPTPPAAAPAEAKLAPPGKISPETVVALQVAIGDKNANAAMAWLTAQGWIKESLFDLSQKRAQKILSNPAGFIETVSKGAQ